MNRGLEMVVGVLGSGAARQHRQQQDRVARQNGAGGATRLESDQRLTVEAKRENIFYADQSQVLANRGW